MRIIVVDVTVSFISFINATFQNNDVYIVHAFGWKEWKLFTSDNMSAYFTPPYSDDQLWNAVYPKAQDLLSKLHSDGVQAERAVAILVHNRPVLDHVIRIHGSRQQVDYLPKFNRLRLFRDFKDFAAHLFQHHDNSGDVIAQALVKNLDEMHEILNISVILQNSEVLLTKDALRVMGFPSVSGRRADMKLHFEGKGILSVIELNTPQHPGVTVPQPDPNASVVVVGAEKPATPARRVRKMLAPRKTVSIKTPPKVLTSTPGLPIQVRGAVRRKVRADRVDRINIRDRDYVNRLFSPILPAASPATDTHQNASASASASTSAANVGLLQSRTKRRYRHKPGTVALREIKKYQRSTDLLIPRKRFALLVREILHDFAPGLRLTRDCLMALQEAAEAAIVNHFELSLDSALHAGRVTVKPADQQLVKAIQRSEN